MGWGKWDGIGKDGIRVDWQDEMGEDDFGWDWIQSENTIFTEQCKLKSMNKTNE